MIVICCSGRDVWFPCLSPRDTAQLFALRVLLRWKNSWTNPVQKHKLIHLQLWVIFSDFSSYHHCWKTYNVLKKTLSSEITHFLTKKVPVPPCFLFIGQGWLIFFLHPAHIHIIKKTSSRCTDTWAQWAAGKAAEVSVFLKNKQNPRAEATENWNLCILFLTIYFNSDGDLKEKGRQFWFFLIWERRNGWYNVYSSSVLTCNIDT